jgi:hypothetical protein
MAANPVECRRRAKLYIELANNAKHEVSKRSLIGVAKNWEKLAEALESTPPTRDRTIESDDSITLYFDNFAGSHS